MEPGPPLQGPLLENFLSPVEIIKFEQINSNTHNSIENLILSNFSLRSFLRQRHIFRVISTFSHFDLQHLENS